MYSKGSAELRKKVEGQVNQMRINYNSADNKRYKITSLVSNLIEILKRLYILW